ncbi:dockerin type I domain-containing protein [Ruminococcus flavefaciens]|uniref:Dockerin domain-containing protein n=1 Tax=Ruminococcus flavefaciens 007c TaxID=1341157 RepID=W7UG48_RUMFL|nr:dockerin type I domain-containing protein [Ruminococcus flavefaciens]EWM54116.1 hypothetical protein RF007C_01200 [Ruminococcus flavefaciens 007c]
MKIKKIIAAALALTIVDGSFNCIQKCSFDTSVIANAAETTTTQKASTTTVTTTSSKSTTTAPVSKNTSTTSASTSVLSTSTTLSITPVDYTLGDVNNDGMIDAVDASVVLAYYARISTNHDGGFTELQKLAADFNHDGKVDAVDASNILSYYTYISTSSEKGNGSPSDNTDDNSKSEAEDISISFDMTGFGKNDLDMYAVSESVTELKGSLTGKDRISKLEYTIKNADEKNVSSGNIKIDDTWSIFDFGLDIGSNTVTVTATDNKGKKISNSIIIINANMDNLSRTDADLRDTDSDGLNNYFEEKLGTDPEKADTDGDGLTDYEELILVGSDPLSVDTDENGITDDTEDPDEDGLCNLKEVKLGTYTYMSDSDNDGISDGDEVLKYNTDPLRYDTDEDGLNDLADINMGFDPNKADTDSNGVPDSEEIIQQEITLSLEEPEIEGLLSVNIDTETNGDINSNTFLLNVYDIDSLASSAPGLIGVPVDIYFGSDFENAKVTFRYDEAALGDTDENDLGIIWHDTENDQLVLLDNTVVDTKNNTVTYDTTHFSTYAVVDKKRFSVQQIESYISQHMLTGINRHFDIYTDYFPKSADSTKYNNAVAFCDRILELWDNKDYLIFHHRKGGSGGYKRNFSDGVLNEHCRKMISGEYGTERYDPYTYLITLGLNAEDDKNSSVLNTTVIMTDGTNAEHYSYVDNYVKLIDQAHNSVYVIDFGKNYDSDMAKTLSLCGGRYIKVNDAAGALLAAHDVMNDTYLSYYGSPDNNGNPQNKASGSKYIFVDGKENPNGETNNERMEYIPYSTKFYNDKYTKEIQLGFFHTDKNVYGSAGVHGSYKDIFDAFSDKAQRKKDYIMQDTIIYSAICASTLFDYHAHDVFYSYYTGIGGDSQGIEQWSSRKLVPAYKYFIDSQGLYNQYGKNYITNIAEAKKAVEDKINSGYDEAYIANSREHPLPGGEFCHCTFDNRVDILVNGVSIALNLAAFGTFNAADAGNVVHYTYDKSTNKITMTCKYYIIDYYDYEKYDYLREQDAAGVAKSFELFGVYEATYTWTKGKDDVTGGINFPDTNTNDTDGESKNNNNSDDDHNDDFDYFASEKYFEDLIERTKNQVNPFDDVKVPFKKYCKQLADNMMEDFEKYENKFDMNTIPDDRWEAFVETFVFCVKEYGEITQEMHYFRNKLNRAPATLDDLIAEKGEWELLSPFTSMYHMNNTDFSPRGEYNVKFISTNGHYEAVYNKEGILLTEYNDPDNMGTFNYTSPNSIIDFTSHQKYDVKPYNNWGNVEGGTVTSTSEGLVCVNRYEANLDAREYRRGVEMLLEGNAAGEKIVKANYAGAYRVTGNFNYPVDYSMRDNELKFPELNVGDVANYSVSKDTVIVLDDRGFCTQGYDNDTKFNFVNFYFVPFIDVYLKKKN